MTRLFIDDVSAGMILDIDVYDDTGKITYFKGQVLTNVILKHIDSMGYMTIEITNSDYRDSEISRNTDNIRKKQALCTTAEMLSPKIEKVFKNHINSPLMQKIKEMALQSITEFWKNNK